MNLSVGTTTFVVKITKLPVFLLMSMVLVLQGCGGGDGGGNTAPVAAADAIIVDEGGTVAALTGGVTSVLANDTDADGNTLTAVLVSNPANGSLTLNSNGSFSYTHNGSETTADSFTYRANDGIDNSNTVTVSITVNPINDAPIAAADSIIVAEGGTATTLDNGSSTVLNNDSDAEGDAMEVTLISGTSNGALTLNANGTFSYTHNGGETTTDSFTYQLTDAVLDSNIVTVSITVTPVDDPAALSDDGNSITEDAVPNTVGGNVLSNDTDVDSPLVVTNAGTLSGTYGSLLLNADGSYTYTLDNGNTAVNALNSGGTLSDTFVYNANGQSANLVITINGADDATVLNGDGNSITEDAVPNTVSGNVLSNDVDPDTALTVTNAGTLSGTYGSLLLNADGSYTYTLDNGNAAVNALNSGGTLSDTFVYNANGQSAGLTITINGADDATVLNGDGNSITEDAVPNTVSGNVLSNDVDPDTALTVTNAGTLSGTYGSLLLNADGSYTYTLDNGNAAVNALNSGDTLTDTFAYNANGQSANLEITINGNTDAASISMSGVWMGPAVVTSDPGACSAGLGSIDNNAITITQTGSTLTAKVSNGASLTGTINTSTGDFSFPLVSNTGVLSGVRPDLTQPLNDTAIINWSVDLNVAGTATAAGQMSGTIDVTLHVSGLPDCSYTQTFTNSNLVYQHTGTENYAGNYAAEMMAESASVDSFVGFRTAKEQRGFPFQLETFGTLINAWLPTGPRVNEVSRSLAVVTNTFNPSTGYFELETEEVVKYDFNADTFIDATNVYHNKYTGIFMADPAVTGGTNGAPMIMANLDSYERNYSGDKDAGGLPFGASFDSGPAYAKRVNTSGLTRTILTESNNLTAVSRVMVGLNNPPLKTAVSTTGRLRLQVLDGPDVAGSTSVLCSGDYFNDFGGTGGRFFGHLNMPDPDFDTLQFRTNNTVSTVNCDASQGGSISIPHATPLAVRILDTGPNGVMDTTGVTLAGDDIETVYTVTTSVAPVAERYTQNTAMSDIDVNGARASVTQSGNDFRLRGFFNGTKPINVSWPGHPETTTSYQLRAQDPDGYVKRRFNTTTAGYILPAGTIGEDDVTLQLLAINNATSNGAVSRAQSRRIKLHSGITGSYNVEVNHPNFRRGIFQINLSSNPTGFVCSIRKPVDPAVMDCTGGSIDYATDTVTANLTFGATPITLTLVFSDAVNATASMTNGADTWTGHAKLSDKELRVRTSVDSGGFQSTVVSMIMANRPEGILTSASGQDFGFGGGPGAPLNMWLTGDYDTRLRSFYGMPMDDQVPQNNMIFISSTTATPLAADTLTLTMQNYAGDPTSLTYQVNYGSPDATALYAPAELPPLRSAFSLNGNPVPGNAGNNTNAVNVSGSSGVLTFSWPNNLADAANTLHQIRIRFRDAANNVLPHDQFRTVRLTNGSGGLSLSADTTTWTWDSTGIFAIPAGTYADIEVIASDTANTIWGRSQRFVVYMP